MQILSDLLVSRGIDPAGLERHERCDVCRKNGPDLYQDYQCIEAVCRDLWGDLADLHWKKAPSEEKRDIREVLRGVPKTLLDTVLRRNRR